MNRELAHAAVCREERERLKGLNCYGQAVQIHAQLEEKGRTEPDIYEAGESIETISENETGTHTTEKPCRVVLIRKARVHKKPPGEALRTWKHPSRLYIK